MLIDALIIIWLLLDHVIFLTVLSLFVGSSTACIVALDKNKQSLHTANLGDSGFLVVRKGDIVHRSIEQQHAFNTPYQLAIPPENNPDVLRDS